ncbi:hypothetical protein KAS50_01620, partial [bacterium]|nr:hypothetical protein [bacterium]
EFSHYVMSEIPFLFFSFLGIYLFEKYKDEPLRGYRLYIAIAAVAFAYYVRSTGIALVGAAVFYYILKMEWKRLLAVGGSFFALLFPWYLRNANLEGGSSYLNQLILVNPYRPEMGTLGFDTLIGRLAHNFKVYFLGEIPHCIMPLNVRPTMLGPGEVLPLFLSVILLLIFIAGFIWAFINRQYFLTVYGTFYLIIVMLWPEVWSGNRFILPITPLFVYFSAYLFYKLRDVLREKIPLIFREGLVYILALFLLIISVKNIYAYGETVKNYPPVWANYFKAAEWARDNLPEDAVFADRKGGLFGTVSKRTCGGFHATADKKALIESLYRHKVDYVVLPSIPYADIPRYLLPAVNEYIHKFKQVYFIDNPPTYILKFDRTKDLTE